MQTSNSSPSYGPTAYQASISCISPHMVTIWTWVFYYYPLAYTWRIVFAPILHCPDNVGPIWHFQILVASERTMHIIFSVPYFRIDRLKFFWFIQAIVVPYWYFVRCGLRTSFYNRLENSKFTNFIGTLNNMITKLMNSPRENYVRQRLNVLGEPFRYHPHTEVQVIRYR